jgi:phosphoglycolate phosphatase-like HAD superfamily hydrolase
MGKTAGCTTILVKTGYGGKDKKHNVKPDYIQKDLLSCARLISKIIKNKKIK